MQAVSLFVCILFLYKKEMLNPLLCLERNYFAYVYPTQPYKIYLCKVFWQAGMTGTDSKMVSEISSNVTYQVLLFTP